MNERPKTAKLKREFIKWLISSNEVVNLIDNREVETPDDLINKSIYKWLKIPDTIQDVGTYICIQLQYPSTCDNEVYKDFNLVVTIIANNRHIITSAGDSRVDLLAEKIMDLFVWNSSIGFTMRLKSDVEDAFNDDFYYRRLLFSSITENGYKNGVKQKC